MSGDSSQLAAIPSGELYVIKPNSPKNPSQCLALSASLSIKKTSVDFQHELLAEKLYEEGEQDLEDSLEDGEWSFLIDEALKISYTTSSDKKDIVIVWENLAGSKGSYYKFVCADSVRPAELDRFDLVARQCQYERKYRESSKNATGAELEEFEFAYDKKDIVENNIKEEGSDTEDEYQSADEADNKNLGGDSLTVSKAEGDPLIKKEEPVQDSTKPETELAEVNGTKIFEDKISLHLFDPSTSTFVEQLASADVFLYDQGNFQFWLEVDSPEKRYLGIPVSIDMNPVFNYEHLSFIFNFFTAEAAYSWLLRFKSFDALEKFQELFMQAVWENNNKEKWTKVKPDERDYLIEQFQDIDMKDVDDLSEDEDEEMVEESEESEKEEYSTGLRQTNAGQDYDEGYDDIKRMSGKGKNSQLAVGHSNDRTYVVRENKLGVFKQTDDNELEFQTTIDNIATTRGKEFIPSKVMLHTRDKAMVFQDPDDPHSLYRMDLEYGKIVDEWNVSDDYSIKGFAPIHKYAQATEEQSVLGVSDQALFKIDPRLQGSKLVESQLKNYATKVNFSSLSSTDNGYIAVASQKGEIRLYDRLGINAKTSLPGMGDAITGIDVSSDGKWILATCKTYLLLIDATIKEGKNEGNVGFLKSFGKDSKPRPKRLQISPEHLAHMQTETKKPLDFTKAHFNAGIESKEQSIVTSSGPFVITWSLKKILRGDKSPYLIKRYSDNVAADNFKFGSDKSVIIALDNDVGMVDRRTFRKPTRESLATPSRRIQPMAKNKVVNTLN